MPRNKNPKKEVITLVMFQIFHTPENQTVSSEEDV